jgi:hypothetical protein
MIAMWWRLSLIGLIGCASFALVSFDQFEQFGEAPINPALLRLLAVLQPAILVALCVALGNWAAPKVGFDSPAVRAWAERRPIWPELKRQLPAATLGGLAIAFLLVGFWTVVRAQDFTSPVIAFELPLATKLLYGGIVEELLLRWGLMSFFVWVAWRLGGRTQSVPGWTVWTGMVAAAILFAIAHLPILYFLLPDPPLWFVGMTLVANFIPGMVFGWLFWRRGLEAAIVAHALAHLFSTSALANL